MHIRPQPRKLTIEDIRHFPKAELHCHLDGSIRPKTVLDMAVEQGVKLDTFDLDELEKILRVPENCPDLVTYLRSFDISLKVLQEPYALTRTVYEIAEDAHKDGLTYLEIRFAPILHTSNGMTLSEVMHAVMEGVLLAERNLPIVVRIIVCAMRQLDPKQSLNAAEIAWRYRDMGVVGFDVAGPENGFSPEKHRAAYNLVRQKGLHSTVHAGEAAGWESVDHALRHCGAQRLGHGVRVLENPALFRTVIDQRITIESCPTSNTQTGAVKSLAVHPIREFFDNGCVVVPCTDNTTVSNVSLSSEYLRLHLERDFSVEELVRMVDYGFNSAFIPYALRSRLRLDAMQKILTYLHSQNFDISGLMQDLPTWDTLFYGITPRKITPEAYFDSYKNPPISIELIRKLPKVDLHVRLVGGMTLDTLWRESEKEGDKNALFTKYKTKEAFLLEFTTKYASPQSRLTMSDARRHILDVMQTKEQLEATVDDIFRVSSEDGIVYQEIMLRPADHTERHLNKEQVIEVVLAALHAGEAKYNIRSSLFLACRLPEDGPIECMETAKTIIEYNKKGVVGFATFGNDIEAASFSLFDSAFWYLKKHNIPVIISSARTAPRNVIPAVVEGQTSRISGGYTLHQKPQVVKFLADRQIPVDVSITTHVEKHSKEMESFAGNVVRYLLDNDVRVILCSLGRTLEMCMTLTEVINKIKNDCKISVSELIELLGFAFRCCSLPYQEREKMHQDFLRQIPAILAQHNVRHYLKKPIFEECSLPFPQPHPHLESMLQGKSIYPQGSLKHLEPLATTTSTSDQIPAISEATPSPSPPTGGLVPHHTPLKVITPAGETIRVAGGSACMTRLEASPPPPQPPQ